LNIPGFKLGRPYAEGPHSKGYNALNLSNHKTVNIQVFDPSLLSNQQFVEQFREATDKLVDVSAGIMTPTLQAGILNQTCYVISEYFPNPQQLTSAPPSLNRVQLLHLALQLAETLDQLHRVGLIHGGVEYSSLHIRTYNQMSLRPVMLQRVLPILRPMAIESLAQQQRVYLPPEGSEALTPASDFYALGVLYGSIPFI